MTLLDRAFIKAYGEPPAAAPATPQRAPVAPAAKSPANALPPIEPVEGELAWPSGRPSPPLGQALVPPSPAMRKPMEVQAEVQAPVTSPFIGVSTSQPTLPLSSFTTAAQPEESARARHEVDRLNVPAPCEALINESTVDWAWFVDHLVMQMGLGQKRIAITSLQVGAGRTTVCLAVTRQLAARGLRPLLVDADNDQPELANLCSLEEFAGWDEALLSDVPIDEALVVAIEDGVTLMPWRGPTTRLSELAASGRTTRCFKLLSDHYDLIVFDAPTLATQQAVDEFATLAHAIDLDGVYVVDDSRGDHSDELLTMCQQLHDAGLTVDGIIENFVAVQPDGESAPPADAN